MASGLGKPPEFGVERGQVEVGAGARRIEAAGALEMRKSGGRIALQEDRQAQLLVRLGPIGRALHRHLQPSDRLGAGAVLERQRPEVERDFLTRRSRCDRVRHP